MQRHMIQFIREELQKYIINLIITNLINQLYKNSSLLSRMISD